MVFLQMILLYLSYVYELMLIDELICVNLFIFFFFYINGYGGVFNGNFMNSGYIWQFFFVFDSMDLNNIRKEIYDVIFVVNG